jgi:hypothetical protein
MDEAITFLYLNPAASKFVAGILSYYYLSTGDYFRAVDWRADLLLS